MKIFSNGSKKKPCVIFEIEVINLIFFFSFFFVKQFLDNECSITLETLESNKIWICRKRSHRCTKNVTLIGSSLLKKFQIKI